MSCSTAVGGWCRLGQHCGHICNLPEKHDGFHECKCGFKWVFPPKQAWQDQEIIDPAMEGNPHFENFFPQFREAIERYGRACFNHGLSTGLRPAKIMQTWLTSKPPIPNKKLAEFLAKEIEVEEAKRHKK